MSLKIKLAIVAILAVALAAPPAVSGSEDAQILRYENENIGVDGYKFAVETSDGISRQEEGHLTNVGTEDEGISVTGQFSYTGDDGKQYAVNYVADNNGFQPSGEHLPI